MSSTYSTRLYLAHAVTDDRFDVPAGEVWVIRTITVFWPGGNITPMAQLVDIPTLATIWWDTDSISVGGLYHALQDVRIVLPAGSQIGVHGFGDPDIGAFGYVLTPI